LMKCEKNLSSIEIYFRIRIRIEANYGSETLMLISTFICFSRCDFDCKSLFPRTRCCTTCCKPRKQGCGSASLTENPDPSFLFDANSVPTFYFDDGEPDVMRPAITGLETF
jgi:hypothetical protein